MSTEEYNGWTNYETWLMALNIDNDEGLQQEVLEFVYGDDSTPYLLEDWIEDLIAIECHGVQMYKIFDSWSEREFASIDWHELFESYKRDAEDILGDD